jgi:hypothetical protein
MGKGKPRTQRSRLIDTIGAFLRKEVAYGGTLQSDSRRLYSYLVVIGEWDGSTSRHRNMLKAMATAQGIRTIEEVAGLNTSAPKKEES